MIDVFFFCKLVEIILIKSEFFLDVLDIKVRLIVVMDKIIRLVLGL